MIAMSIGWVGNLLGSSLVAIGQSDKPFKVNIIGGVCTIIGNLIMIPIYGVMGAVYTKLLERSITNPLNVIFLRRADIKVKFSGYLKPFGAFGICAFFFWVTKPEGIVTKLLIISIFLVLCALLAVVRKEELAVFIREFRHIGANLRLVTKQNGREAI
jgi:O-antigen/teichoic acid export membrane protein